MRVSQIPYVQGRNAYDDRDGAKFGIAIHNTSNDATDEGEASFARRRTDGTSSHFYVDADSVTQSLDTSKRAGHAGSSTGNDNAIAVEITGGNGKSRAWWLENVAWAQLGRVLAEVIRAHWPDGSFQVRRASVDQMRANPRIKAFYGHDDMRRAWGGTDHTDPGPNFPWDKLFDSVADALGAYGALKPGKTQPAADQEDDMTKAELMGAVTEAVTAFLEGKKGQSLVAQAVLNYDPGVDPDGEIKAGGVKNYGPSAAANPTVAPAWSIGRAQVAAELGGINRKKLDQVIALLKVLSGKDFADEGAIVAGVLEGLDPGLIAAAIPDAIAQQVVTALGERLR